jgi:hypothetical protein
LSEAIEKDSTTVGGYMPSTTDKLREISRTLQIHKKLEKDELLAVMVSLIDIAERLEKVETMCTGRKEYA